MNHHITEIWQQTLQRVRQNDPTLTKLCIGDNVHEHDYIDISIGQFNPRYDRHGRVDTINYPAEISRLGDFISNNTHIISLEVASPVAILDVTNTEFYHGLKQNNSINELTLHCEHSRWVDENIIRSDGVEHELMKVYQAYNRLTTFTIIDTTLQNGGDYIVASALSNYTNLRKLVLCKSDITNVQLLPIIDAVRGHTYLEELDLNNNRIGNSGCESLATLLQDPNCNLKRLVLDDNHINNEGAIAIANSLAHNTKLQTLHLNSKTNSNTFDTVLLQNNFSSILCNTSSIHGIQSSNHTLKELSLGWDILAAPGRGWEQHLGFQLILLLESNKRTNKSHVVMQKILQYHPNIDMVPLYDWDIDGERTLKSLPYVIDWFERAWSLRPRVTLNGKSVQQRMILSAIYQFARAMPLQFLTPEYTKSDGDKKRKREAK